MNTEETLKTVLENQGIRFEVLNHEPFFSADQGHDFCDKNGFSIPKNLVMTNKQKNKFWMITVRGDKKVSLNQLKKDLGVTGPKFSFAPEASLKSLLNVTPGSVSPLGLVFDQEQQIHYFIDADFQEDLHVGFHPNINTQTWKLSRSDFEKFLTHLNRPVTWLNIPLVNS